MLVELELRLSLGIAVVEDNGTTSDRGTWVYWHWVEEFVLCYGSFVLTILLAFILFPAGWLGSHLAGEAGYRIAGDVGFGIIAFGASGMLLHLVRLLALRGYWISTMRTWRPPDGAHTVPEPGLVARRLLTSSDRDAIPQLICAVATSLFLLSVNP